MKNLKIIIISASLVLLSFFATPLQAGCSSGGPGSSECSVTMEVPGGASVTYSVKCREGYYACCNAIGGAVCNERGSQNR